MTTLARDAPPRPRRRRLPGWAIFVVVLVGAGIVGAVISSTLQWSARDALDPASAGPRGTQALARILTQHGIDVVVVRDRAAAVDALKEGPATLVLPDSPYYSDDAFTALADTSVNGAAASDVVVIDARARGVRVLFPGATVAGVGGADPVAPDCGLADANRAGPIVAGTLFAGARDATACYPSGDGAALLTAPRGAGRVAAIDATELFTNAHLAENGNAALALNLLGQHPRVVWLVGGPADTDLADTSPTLADLTPAWVTPVLVLLAAAVVAAAVWRGRRFGPLVAENLPVTVRASETTEGRARLYAQSHDTVHAADQLRIGTLQRLARLLALGPAASATEIADAAADRLAADRSAVAAVLLTDLPRTDGDLLALADRLRDLEAAVRAAGRI